MVYNFKPLKKEEVFKHLRIGLDTGKFVPLPTTEIERIVDEHYLGFEPLNPLTEEEQAEMKPRLIQGVNGYLNSGSFERLCRKDRLTVSYISSRRTREGELIEEPCLKRVFPEDLEYQLEQIKIYGSPKGNKIDVRPVDEEERLRETFDPEAWTDKYSGSSIRHLNEYMTDDFFKMMIGYAREGWNRQGDRIIRTPKEKIRVLEIGTGTGRALTDMKKIDEDIETHGINFAPEFVMYPGHQYHFMNLERMPKEFEEGFDYIHSHQCFRYSAYPDVGYANTLRALSVGGVAWLDLSIDKNPLGFSEGKKREGKIVRMCNQLIKDGFVEPIMKRPTIEEIVKLRSIPRDYQLRE